MGNSIAGTSAAIIAQRTLDTLMREFPQMRAFSTDFSADVANQGGSVTTRVVTQQTMQDFTSTTTAGDAVSTARTITLNGYGGLKLGFSDLEWSLSSVNLHDVFYAPMANAVVEGVMGAALALVTNSAFSTAGFTGAASTFDADDVADLAAALTTAKVPRIPRSLVILPTYYAALAKDAAIQSAYAYGSADPIQRNMIPRVHGFDVYEYSGIPTNNEYLVGFATGPQGILIAARQPSVPNNFPGEVDSATDPESGLTLQVRKWYSADTRSHYLECGIIYGVAVGVAGNLKRIVSQ